LPAKEEDGPGAPSGMRFAYGALVKDSFPNLRAAPASAGCQAAPTPVTQGFRRALVGVYRLHA
jgi:hypothetical protein